MKQVQTVSGPLTILQSVSLEIKPAATVAITGASGSGKSTLLALLAGLDLPTSGVIELAGVDITTLDEDSRARLRAKWVGFVFQSFQLLPNLTALENVMLPLELQRKPTAKVEAEQLLQRVGLADRHNHYPKHLSGGEQQRVALARAFVTRPALLFADEPTGNLDSATGETIIELLFQLNAEQGTTLVLVTHDNELALRCGNVIQLQNGRVVT